MIPDHVSGRYDITEKFAICDTCAYSRSNKTDNGYPGKCPKHPNENMIVLDYHKGALIYYRRLCRFCIYEVSSQAVKDRLVGLFPGVYS